MGGAEFFPALAALGSAATWAFGSHLFRRALQGGHLAQPPSAAAANLFKNALAFLVFAALLPLAGGALPETARWPLLMASGVFGFALGDTLYFVALPLCGVQVAAMLALVQVPAAVVLGWALHGERLPAGVLLGAFAVVAGVALVITETPRSSAIDARRRRAGIVCAGAAAVSQAVGVVLGHQAMQGADVLGGTLVRTGGGIAGAFVIAAVLGLLPGRHVAAELAQLVRPWWDRTAQRGLVVAAIFGSIVALPLFHYALRALPSGVAAVLFATTPLFTLPLGFAMGERHGLRAVLGALVGFAGVAAVVAAVT